MGPIGLLIWTIICSVGSFMLLLLGTASHFGWQLRAGLTEDNRGSAASACFIGALVYVALAAFCFWRYKSKGNKIPEGELLLKKDA